MTKKRRSSRPRATADTIERVAEAVRTFLFDRGFPPTFAEIGERAGIAKETAHYHVGRLVAAKRLQVVQRRVMLPKGQNPHELVRAQRPVTKHRR